MLVAVCDQSTGTSTSRCSKITAPLSLPMEAVRVSHWTSSYGVLPASRREVKYLGNETPDLVVVWVFNNSIFAPRSTANWPMWNLLILRDLVIGPQHMVVRQELYLYAGS